MRLNNVVFVTPAPSVITIGVETKSLIEIPIADLIGTANVTLHCEAILVVEEGVTSSASLRIARSLKQISGTLTALGTQATAIGIGIGDAALATAAAVLDANGGFIRVRGTGIALLTLDWTAHLHIWSGEF